jgi:hypothetical protein
MKPHIMKTIFLCYEKKNELEFLSLASVQNLILKCADRETATNDCSASFEKSSFIG